MNWKNKLIDFIYTERTGVIVLLVLGSYLLFSNSSHFILICETVCFLILSYLLSCADLKIPYFCLALILPFSIKFELDTIGIALWLPSELLIGMLSLALIFKGLREGFKIRNSLQHPISILLLLFLILSAVSVIFSSMPLVSLKAFWVRLVYIQVFYFGVISVFKKGITETERLFTYYGGSLFIIAICCLYFQFQYGLSKQSAAYSVYPFYADHTIFSACVVFVLPAFFIELHKSLKNKASAYYIGFICSSILVFLLAVFYTYCRAAWISIAAELLFLGMIRAKIKPRSYLFLILIGAAFLYIDGERILLSFNGNNNVSTSYSTSAIEQTQSITNVRTDLSNAERLNRWSCAIRMFLDKPITGFGPGTFQFQYLAYQLPSEITYISVFSPYNIPLGRGGSAHNEYLLLLSECGGLCFLIFIIFIVVALLTAIKSILGKSNEIKKNELAVLLGFFTYCIHGLFNNFLDTDKAAFLFYAALASIVLLSENKVENARTQLLTENKEFL